MARKKPRPIRSGTRVSEVTDHQSSTVAELLMPDDLSSISGDDNNVMKPFFINIEPRSSLSDEHFDVAEITLGNIKCFDGIANNLQAEEICGEDSHSLRFCLLGFNKGSFRFGSLPSFSADNIQLEYVHNSASSKEAFIILSGQFDGPDESICSLVHLVSLKLLGLRLMLETVKPPNNLSVRVRIEILRSAFDACKHPLEVKRQPWRRSMMNVMLWLRPEVATSEVIYGMGQENVTDGYKCDRSSSSGTKNYDEFDVTAFYEAIKPSKEEPVLEKEFPDLFPRLRPYQQRAVYWMFSREKGTPVGKFQHLSLAPFSIPIVFLGGQSTMFYNPFNGDVSWNPPPYSNVSGGILADEMGLGKTVELLACIFANFKQSADVCITDNDFEDIRGQIKRQKIERVECICGAASESTKYEGVWVQCDICDAWQHADCVRDSPRKVPSFSLNMYKSSEKFQPVKSVSDQDRRGPSCDVEMEGDFVCYLCSELIEAASIKISTGATLIICPETIQAQWYSEIIRHTRPGSLKIYIYEGARSITTSAALNHIMHKLATADIVITTYTVLKEDLSHDSDRQDGDRCFLRFQKRYPVIPTLLTRIHWWRLCLDEAQMVERNTGSVTEMAMRLHAHHRWCITGTPIQHKLDDLFGLLRFLRASPFDTCRWWVQVVRDPYERKDKVAIEFVHKLFKQIMWRSSKIHVTEELQLPPQEVCLQWLILSPIEEHFYQKQHETCVRFAKEIITSNSHGREFISGPKCSSDSILSNDEVSKLLWPLLKLRQACCHPQVGSSGLCSLQKTPLSMEKILEILIGKSKIEGEEALRRITVALNGLAGVSLIEKDNERAVSIYKEALAIADENADDYRLDPLLNLHIHHNLAELLSLTSEHICQCNGWQCSETNARKSKFTGKYDQRYVKRQKNGMDHIPNLVINGESSEKHGILNSSIMNNNLHRDKAHDSEKDQPSRCFAVGCLRETCENIKQKYLSSYLSKLSLVQLEFRNCYNEVCSLFEECKVGMSWWVQVLDIIEKKKESSHELIKKIGLAISKVHSNFRSLQVYSGFRNMKGLKYTIQVGLDSLQTCREAWITPLLQIGQTVEKPDESVVARVRDCPYCSSGDGNLCLHCELDFLFQKYEAKLFLLRNTNDHDAIPSLGEALDHQKRKYELNSFFRNVNTYTGSGVDYKESKQRHAKENIEVLRHPSALEITLKVLSSYSKAILGRQDYALARKHLQLFEAMRKEFAQARLLSSSQAQLICAHDEIKLSTSRLRLQENESEPTALNILKREDLIPCSMQFSTDKFVSLSLLSRMKGQLRYLKGLVAAKVEINQPIHFSPSGDKVGMHIVNSETSNECRRRLKVDDEPCPICHEKLESQKMVFECGHVLCCKCFLHLTDKAIFGSGKCQNKWLMCPTCRQHTDMEQVAYVDEKLNKHSSSRASQAFNAQDMNECAIAIRGSYGTKIEAVTRKILWITSTNRTAKILVFSSWNDVLDVLQHALDSNDITYVRMKGGRKSQVALTQFKGDIGSSEDIQLNEKFSKSKGFQVLLIPIHHGSNGLNLLEAQHVILVEPLLNPAVEAQAISRVHRIGQEKKTFVHRFIVKNTVEESIYKLNLSRSGSPIAGTKPSKTHDLPTLTLQDVKSLFPSLEAAESSEENLETVRVSEESLRHLPACVAAAVAAERRLMMDSQDNH